MKEHDHRYVAITKSMYVDGANTVTLKERTSIDMQHYQTSRGMDGSNTNVMMFSTATYCCDVFQVDRLT